MSKVEKASFTAAEYLPMERQSSESMSREIHLSLTSMKFPSGSDNWCRP
jgi:hypothetical protein